MNAEKMRVGLDAECCSCGATPEVVDYTIKIDQKESDCIKLACPNACSESRGFCLLGSTRYEAIGLAIDDWNSNPIVIIKLTPEQYKTFKEKGGNAWFTTVLDGLAEN